MTRVRQSCMPHSVREGVLHFMGRHMPQESDANTVIFLPRSLAQLRVFVGVLCSTQPRPPVHTVIIHGSGDFRGALARALTSSISWCQVGWLTLRMASCFGLGEATVCRLLQHLQEEAVNLGEFILELPGVSMGDTIARQISGLLRARSRTLRCCALGLQSNQMMSHDGVWVYFSGLAFLVLAEVSLDQGVPPLLKYTLDGVMDLMSALATCRVTLTHVSLDFQGMALCVSIFSGAYLTSLLMQSGLSTFHPGDGCGPTPAAG